MFYYGRGSDDINALGENASTYRRGCLEDTAVTNGLMVGHSSESSRLDSHTLQ